ncbi:cuticle protein 1-like [Cydia pomonella]|uniref:cuticle protein 1-like n=1 Tax=Cydia pomonella TaxID=82600 RepID=UPI002ADDD37A|nr:cuticle protein 1-like [Cydia pomonella]
MQHQSQATVEKITGIMFIKTLFVCAVAAVAMGIEYPPGVDPLLCPNYPYCNVELMARYKTLPYIPDYQIPYARMVYAAPYPIAAPIPVPAPIPDPAPIPVAAPVAAPDNEEPATLPSAPLYPADVDPASCPNYPYCT